MEKKILNLINKLHFVSSKMHMFHWNVTGKDFLSYHKFFETSYRELLEQKDQMAEYLRFSGFSPVINFEAVTKMAESFVMPKTAEKMLEDALKDYHSVLADYTDKSFGEDPVLDAIISDILKDLEKKIYFIKSILS
jgi:starvation-inducible DNA-binding protein